MSVNSAYRRLRKPAALAATTASLFPGERPADYPILNKVLNASSRFWDQKSVVRQGDPTQFFQADDLTGSDMHHEPRARGAGVAAGFDQNAIYFKAPWLKRINNQINSRDAWLRRQALKRLYALTVHEEGHVRGLDHSGNPETDIMHQEATLTPEDWRSVAKEILGRRYFTKPGMWVQQDGNWVHKRKLKGRKKTK